MTDTKLAQLLRKLDEAQRARLAIDCGTSLGYLRQLAGCHRVNPSVKLALKLEKASRRLYLKHRTPIVTVEDLAAMCPVEGGK